ncbi:hypothetical protein BJX68DRAFT_242530 [Aspergillus pseudodeflectus]|uniref:Uncharacterized protein n=1 Tax=Aspergillus pseudodeflectus TaxID=176178 RepID=A0ABR4JXV8_9EURO
MPKIGWGFFTIRAAWVIAATIAIGIVTSSISMWKIDTRRTRCCIPKSFQGLLPRFNC